MKTRTTKKILPALIGTAVLSLAGLAHAVELPINDRFYAATRNHLSATAGAHGHAVGILPINDRFYAATINHQSATAGSRGQTAGVLPINDPFYAATLLSAPQRAAAAAAAGRAPAAGYLPYRRAAATHYGRSTLPAAGL